MAEFVDCTVEGRRRWVRESVSEHQVTGGLRIRLESLGELVHRHLPPLSESWLLSESGAECVLDAS